MEVLAEGAAAERALREELKEKERNLRECIDDPAILESKIFLMRAHAQLAFRQRLDETSGQYSRSQIYSRQHDRVRHYMERAVTLNMLAETPPPGLGCTPKREEGVSKASSASRNRSAQAKKKRRNARYMIMAKLCVWFAEVAIKGSDGEYEPFVATDAHERVNECLEQWERFTAEMRTTVSNVEWMHERGRVTLSEKTRVTEAAPVETSRMYDTIASEVHYIIVDCLDSSIALSRDFCGRPTTRATKYLPCTNPAECFYKCPDRSKCRCDLPKSDQEAQKTSPEEADDASYKITVRDLSHGLLLLGMLLGSGAIHR